MNLDQLITEAYSKYQAELKAKKEAEELEEKHLVEEAIAQYRSNLDKFVSHELQTALGIKFDEEEKTVFGDFEYRGIEFSVIQDRENEWRLVRKVERNFVFVLSDSPSNFAERLLIALGEIREENPEPKIDTEQIKKFQETLNCCYDDVQKIIESETWKRLCDHYPDPEIKTHLGDVLHYLEQALGCIDEFVNQRYLEQSMGYPQEVCES
ncbi:hypothetical protein LC593_10885 [Nostoc sp. CHAB 5844]|nr:hypothetical protein [Nostoc sp. CHAB 5844]